MNVAVIGLGKIGLPLAVQIANKGHRVFGYDLDPAVVSKVNLGKEPFPGEAYLEEKLKEVIYCGKLQASSDARDAVANAEVIVVAVPLLINDEREPDFNSIDSAVESIGRYIKRGALVSFETTLPVGTTKGRLTPKIAEISNLIPGKDFYVVFSPERVFSGRFFLDLGAYPKLLGGIDEKSAFLGCQFYESFIDFVERSDLERRNGVWDLKSCEAAELAKLAETTYRDVNIALANQFSLHASKKNIDIRSVIEACNSQPYSHIHRPGISVGGHCIPVYPWLYLQGDPTCSLVRESRRINDEMPVMAVNKILEELKEVSGKRVLILGVAYRAGVKEHALSGTFVLANQLSKRGALVEVLDPLFEDQELSRLGLSALSNESLVEILILHTPHDEFKHLDLSEFHNLECVFDLEDVLEIPNKRGITVINTF